MGISSVILHLSSRICNSLHYSIVFFLNRITCQKYRLKTGLSKIKITIASMNFYVHSQMFNFLLIILRCDE